MALEALVAGRQATRAEEWVLGSLSRRAQLIPHRILRFSSVMTRPFEGGNLTLGREDKNQSNYSSPYLCHLQVAADVTIPDH